MTIDQRSINLDHELTLDSHGHFLHTEGRFRNYTFMVFREVSIAHLQSVSQSVNQSINRCINQRLSKILTLTKPSTYLKHEGISKREVLRLSAIK